MDQKFETKDSGKREQFQSGMVRDTQDGKLRYDLAFDGPLFWALFKGTKYSQLVTAAQNWYENGGVDAAASVIQELANLESGGDVFGLVDRYTELMMRGAIKYSERNWMKAAGEAEYYRFRASFARHLSQYLRGQRDEDHGAAVFFNLNGAEYVFAKSMKKQAALAEQARLMQNSI